MQPTTILLLALFFCHFLADYTHLSTSWMLNAKRFGTPLFPIFVHALIHAVLMAFAIIVYSNHCSRISPDVLGGLFLLQLITHFLIDVWKGKMNFWFPSLQNNTTKGHWIIFGFDQFLHAFVIILMYNQLIN